MAAERLFAETSQEMEAIHAVLNRGPVAFSSGDLPAALSFLDEAAARYRPLNVPTPALSIDRCAVLLAAGLVSDALAEADAAVADIEQAHGRSTKKAELLLMAANCALAAAQPQVALDRARAARRLFRSQQNAWGKARADLVLARARYRVGPASPRLLRQASQVAIQLEALGSAEASLAHLLAGRVALDLGRPAEADRHLGAAARSRRRGPAMARASGWLAEALRAQAAAEPRRLLAACRRGLEVLDEHRFTLGASELRAQATAHGAELAALAQRHAAQARRPRLFLAWTERWRATALSGARGAAHGRRGTQRRPRRAARGDQAAGGGAAAGRDRPGRSSGSSCASRARYGPARCRPGGRPTPAAPASTSRNCSISSAPPSSSRSPMSTASCTCSSAGRARYGSSPPAAPRMPSAPRTSPGSACAAWPAAGPGTTRTARWPS